MKTLHGKLVVPGLLLALVAAFTAVSATGQTRDRRGLSRQDRMEYLAEKLDLTSGQKEAVETLFAEHDREMEAQHEVLRIARDDLHARIHAPTFDESGIRSAASGVAAIEEELAVARGRMLKEMRGILSEEQYAEFERIHPRRDGRRAFRGIGRGPGPHAHRGWRGDED